MKTILCCAFAGLCLAASARGSDLPAWRGHAANAQHTARALAAGQSLTKIHWEMAVDLAPPSGTRRGRGGGGEITAHYASPMITAENTVLVPVKTTAKGDFKIDAVEGATGKIIWTTGTDYVLPPHNSVPPLPAHLTAQNRLYYAGAGGTVFFRDSPDSKKGTSGQLAFYGLATYRKNRKIFDHNVMIDTPITADEKGNIYFGFLVQAANPAHLVSGIARIDSSGNGIWIKARKAGRSVLMTQVAMNCAPAVSADGKTIYIAVSNGSIGYLVGLDSTTLKPEYRTTLIDPKTGDSAGVSDDSSATPTIGPDGKVYYGVFDSDPNGDHNCRGWLLNFSADLATENAPGSFGWDDTVSIVPKDAVPHYAGKSSYYIMSKYNNYIDCGGNGQNQLAILDPDATQMDEFSDVTVLKQVETILDPNEIQGEEGRYEWCVNTAAVDDKNNAVFVNDEFGYAYRWDLPDNTLDLLPLNAPTSEAYTPTLIGADGTNYAINNATLYAIGN